MTSFATFWSILFIIYSVFYCVRDTQGIPYTSNYLFYPAYFGAGGGSGGDIHQESPELLTPEPEDEAGSAGGTGGGMVFAIAQNISYSSSIQSSGISGTANGNSYGEEEPVAASVWK